MLLKLKQYFKLTKEEDWEVTYAEIADGAMFKGYNVWLMCCAMLIACIGLTTNNLSAIIGAMLISPLMGPIIGFAFGLAISDNNLKETSFKNWLVMSVVSLFAAFIYFWINPFNNYTAQTLSFEKATIFDIMLAILGGIAGFIGLMRKEGTKVLSGVAAATSCMPPLCVAAEGARHGHGYLFVGGLYFYLINCLFIGFSTFILARLLGYQKSKNVTAKTKYTFIWVIVCLLMLLPATYHAYNKWLAEYKKPETTMEDKIKKLELKVQTLDSILSKK